MQPTSATAPGFLDLGLDSILAVTWIRRLNARFGIELPATAVYAQPTVGALAARIAELLPAEATVPSSNCRNRSRSRRLSLP